MDFPLLRWRSHLRRFCWLTTSDVQHHPGESPPATAEEDLLNAIYLQYLHDEEATTSFTFNNSISLWMSTSAAADVGISVALWLKLRSQLGAGFEVTDSVLRTVESLAVR